MEPYERKMFADNDWKLITAAQVPSLLALL
jgi:hypothetical protein